MENILGIHVYGHIDAMFYTLNALALITHSVFFSYMMTFLMVTGIAFSVVKSAINPEDKSHFKHMMVCVLIIQVMFTPKVSMNIYDQVTKQRDKIDNIPLGFALPVGIIENMGNSIADRSNL